MGMDAKIIWLIRGHMPDVLKIENESFECGKRAPMFAAPLGRWLKPDSWFERSDEEGIQTACCRECIDKIAKKTGKTGVVLPV